MKARMLPGKVGDEGATSLLHGEIPFPSRPRKGAVVHLGGRQSFA